jgi:formate dehydrogenase major subunit
MLNPAVKVWTGPANAAALGSGRFPYVCTTFSLTEHWQSGVMTRHMPWLLELAPQVFVEMDLELAGEKGIEPGDLVQLTSERGSITAVAAPTARLRPLVVAGKKIHQLAVPWCFGWVAPRGEDRGPRNANRLTPNIGDANTMIPETKAFIVDLIKLGT